MWIAPVVHFPQGYCLELQPEPVSKKNVSVRDVFKVYVHMIVLPELGFVFYIIIQHWNCIQSNALGPTTAPSVDILADAIFLPICISIEIQQWTYLISYLITFKLLRKKNKTCLGQHSRALWFQVRMSLSRLHLDCQNWKAREAAAALKATLEKSCSASLSFQVCDRCVPNVD